MAWMRDFVRWFLSVYIYIYKYLCIEMFTNAFICMESLERWKRRLEKFQEGSQRLPGGWAPQLWGPGLAVPIRPRCSVRASLDYGGPDEVLISTG